MNTEVSYISEEVIIREGAMDGCLYSLQEGVVEIRKKNVVIAELNVSGTVFGEIGAILGKPRTCSAVAKTDVKVIRLANNIDDIIRSSPILTKMIMSELAERLEKTTIEFAKAKDLIISFKQ